jgi:hypothetical protein
MILPQSRLSRLTLASLATLLSAAAVHADPVLLSTTGATAGTSVASPNSYSTTGYVNSNSNISNGVGYGSAYSFANAGGAYAVSSSAQGKASGNALSSFTNTFINTSSVAQHFTLSFHIYGGRISTYTNTSAGLTGAEELSISYAASVKTKIGSGPEVTSFSSTAQIVRNAGGSTLTRSGTNLKDSNTDVSDGVYDWSNDYYTVDLGVVGAGASFDVVAEVQNMAFADVGTYSFGGGGGPYGGYGCYYPTGRADVGSQTSSEGQCSGFNGSASSFYGDPIAIDSLDFPAFTGGPVGQFALGTINDLPEPAGLALVGAGLAAAAAVRRRRKS